MVGEDGIESTSELDVEVGDTFEEYSRRVVNADLDNHLAFLPGQIHRDYAYRALDRAFNRLGNGGILGVLDYNPQGGKPLEFYETFVSRLIGNPREGHHFKELPNALHVKKLNENHRWEEVLILRGEEVETEHGHVVLVGGTRDNFFEAGLPVTTTLLQANAMGVAKGVDHPYFPQGGLMNFLLENDRRCWLDRFDFFELVSKTGYAIPFRDFNKPASEIYFAKLRGAYPDLTGINASDGHSIAETGLYYSPLSVPGTYDGLTSGRQAANLLRTALKESKARGLDILPDTFGASERWTSRFWGGKHIADCVWGMAKDKLRRNQKN